MPPRQLLPVLALTALAVANGACAQTGGGGASPVAAAPSATGLTAGGPLVVAGGKAVGQVALSEGPAGVLIRVEAQGLPPGWHGAHLHQVGDCSDQGFQKSGGHTHDGPKSVHGLLNPASTDTGDLPNVHVAADGSLRAELFTAFVTLGSAAGRQPLLNADGAALLLHANADDHVSQPIGGAGARIACAVIRRTP